MGQDLPSPILKMKNEAFNSAERGAVILETAIVTPLLVMFFLFVIDFLIMSKSQTALTQATRDAGIYYSTFPLPLQIGSTSLQQNSSLYQDENYADTCIGANAQSSSQCAEKATFYRSYRLLSSQEGQLSLDYQNNEFDMIFSFDGVRAAVTISSKIKTLFFFDEKTIEKTAVLRRIGP